MIRTVAQYTHPDDGVGVANSPAITGVQIGDSLGSGFHLNTQHITRVIKQRKRHAGGERTLKIRRNWEIGNNKKNFNTKTKKA